MAGRRQFGSVRKLASGQWQARYRADDGIARPAPERFATKAEAVAWLAGVQTDLRRGDWLAPELGQVPFGEWAEEWLGTTGSLRAKTQASYRSLLRTHVLPRFGELPVARIRKAEVRRFLADLSKGGVAPGTARNAYRVLRLVLATAVDDGAIRVNPAVGVSLPRSERSEMVFLTAGQVAEVAEAIGPEHGYDLLVTFAAYTGLRAGEIAGLRVGRLDLMRRVVDVRETIVEANGRLVSGPTKTNERRTVPVPPFLADALAAHLGPRAADPEALVFTSPTGLPLRHGQFYRRRYRPAVARAGLPDRTRFHDLRHTCAAFLIARGAHPKAIAELLGHSTITVTLDRYGHLFPSLAEELAAGLEVTYREAKATPPQEAEVHRIGGAPGR